MSTEDRLKIEKEKYVKAYKSTGYKMGKARGDHAKAIVKSWPTASYLDVGCGRGEMVAFAESIGFSPVFGTDIVDYLVDDKKILYGEAHNLPFEDGAIDYITCLDVMEHIPSEDTIKVLEELKRVANKRLLLCIANFKHADYHINIKPYAAWDAILKEVYSSALQTIWHPKGGNISETWEVRF